MYVRACDSLSLCHGTMTINIYPHVSYTYAGCITQFIRIQCHFSVVKLDFQSVVLRKQAMHAYRIKSKIKSILKTNDKANCINMTIYIDNFIVVNEYSG